MIQYKQKYIRGDFIFIQILTEPVFDKSSWGKVIFDSVCSALSKKKIKFEIISRCENFKKADDTHFLILIGSNEGWIKYAVSSANNSGIHPVILSPTKSDSIKGIYSSVTSDIGRSMYYLINHLKKRSKTKPALYGINPASLSDSARKENFLSYANEMADESDIYYNNGSLNNCFLAFNKNHTKYDCVICANDYAAISLIKNLEKRGISLNNLLMISYGNTLLSRGFNNLMTISMCYEEYGKAAISVCDTLAKNSALLYLNIAVKWKIGFRDDFIKNEFPDDTHILVDNEHQHADELFYSDNELCEMIMVENMLSSCDATDLKLLELILKGCSYEQAGEICFISLNTVKYRIKKLMDICNTSNKKAFLELAERYL